MALQTTIYFITDTERMRIVGFLKQNEELFSEHEFRYFTRHPMYDGRVDVFFDTDDQKAQFEVAYRYNIAFLHPS